MERPDITTFPQYRKYLKALFQYKKMRNPHFSFQSLAKKIGSSPSLMKHVLEERKNISVNRAASVAQALEMDSFETDYFTIQLIHDLTRSRVTRQYLSGVLGKLRFRRDSKTEHYGEIREKAGEFLTGNWLAATIHQMFKLPAFVASPEWIRERLLDGERIELPEISAILSRLREMGLIEKTGDSWRFKREAHGMADAFHTKSLEIYREFVGKTFEVLGDPARYKTCQFFISAFALDKDSEVRVLELFNAYREQVTQIAAECKVPDRVLLFSNNLFNVVAK